MNSATVFGIKRLTQLGLALAYACVMNAAWAESKPKEPVSINLTLKRVVTDAKGKEKLEDAPKVKPGELVEYTAVYRNRSNAAVTGLKASIPVPFGLTYIAKSAKPKSVLASTDGVEFAAEPLMKTVKDKDGKESKVETPLAEYRNLRWEVGKLDAGKKVVVSARMRVNDVPKPVEVPTKKPATALDMVTKPEAAPAAPTPAPAAPAPAVTAPAAK